jgi:tetrapyrrole methylase family protein/MazG family protein
MPPDLDAFLGLLDTMRTLRGENGCPWDRVQTHRSLLPYLIEEAYEAYEAIEQESDRAMVEELGDVLLQVIFHAQVAEERGAFAIGDVLSSLQAKLVRRHPDVFRGSNTILGPSPAHSWNQIKAEERSTRGGAKSHMDGIPRALPSLLAAHRVGERAGSVGFDWKSLAGVRQKIDEELHELDMAAQEGDGAAIGAEIGDLLLTIASYARHCGFHAETLLSQAVDRFRSRFSVMEEDLARQGRSFELASADELDYAWRKAKSRSAMPGPSR